MTRSFCLGLFVILSACAQMEEPLEEPVIMGAEITGISCNQGDGIGGTGCPASAVTRNVSPDLFGHE